MDRKRKSLSQPANSLLGHGFKRSRKDESLNDTQEISEVSLRCL